MNHAATPLAEGIAAHQPIAQTTSSANPRRFSEPSPTDLAIVGGGIVGLATAREILKRFPQLQVTVLEKERVVATHQTGHNSGVIHSGIYYRPGSIKARTCVAGAKLMVEFCRQRGIPHRLIGKLVVATEHSEVPRLQQLYEWGLANGVEGLSLIGPERIREFEPCAHGVKALRVLSAGVVDYAAVARAFADEIRCAGGVIRTFTRVRRLVRQQSGWVLETTSGDISCRYLVTCGGLYADGLAAQSGAPWDLSIVPFRGEYYELVPERRQLVKAMIYPVPDPQLPFLGVHFTRAIDDSVHAGPNAVLALKREGYRKSDIHLGELGRLLLFPGFWGMARRYWRTGLEEAYRSWSKASFVRALQRLVPEVTGRDLVVGGSGVRAQALSRQGRLVDDFDIATAERAICVRNVPSPAATASISIAATIAEMAASSFGWR